MMNIAELSIQKKTITLVMIFMMLVGGVAAYQKLGRLEDPEFTIKTAQVITMYPGASAKEVADEVTDKLEIAIQQMGQLDYVESTSEPGRSIITVEIKDAYDKTRLPQVWDELRRKVGDAKKDLPPGATSSIVYDDYGDVFGIFFTVYGDGFDNTELYEHAKMLRRELLLCQDVAKVDLFGVQDEKIYVEITRARLAQLGISPQMLTNTLAGQNLIAPAGDVEVGDQYVRISPTGEFESIEDIGNLLILQAKGDSKLYLKDIAHIYRGYVDPPTKIIRYDGRQAVGIGISTVEGGNAVVMGTAVNARLKELKKETPIGIEVGMIAMQSEAVTVAVNSFMVSLAQAIAIVIGILMFAMGLRSGLLIGLILLLTVLATFIVMDIYGIMLERISLGALIIALGMLVDNAIVVVEGILINMQRGMEKVKAASAIVKQTMWPLFGATVVAILAFAAIGTSQDGTGEYCRSLFYVLMISLFVSWILAITVTPLLGTMFLKVKEEGADADPYAGIFFSGYRWFLTLCVNHRYLTCVVLLVMMIWSVKGFGYVRQSFFPDSTRPQFMIHYWLPQGTKITRTEKDIVKIEKYLMEDFNKKGEFKDQITGVTSCVGAGLMRFLLTYSPENANTSYGTLIVSVDDWTKMSEMIPVIQKHLDDNYPDALAYQRYFVLGPGDPNKIQARVRGPDIEVLRVLATAVQQVMIDEPNATDINSDWRHRVPLVRPVVAEAQARNLGITRGQIAAALNRNFNGQQFGIYREKDELLPIILRAPDEERYDMDILKDIQIWSPAARQSIPIRQVLLGFETTSENQVIARRDRMPTLTVKCDPRVGEATTVFNALRPQVDAKFNSMVQEMNLSGYSLEWGGEYEDTNKAQTALASKMAPILIMMILVVVVLFNSIRQPLLIFMIVPLALCGVTIGLLVTNNPFGFMALLGFMSLAGMLIKNAIVLVDEINAQLGTDKAPYDAIIAAGLSRLRPVSMAALTTVLGMIPLLPDAFFVSMAVTIMFGLTFATILTLIVVPVLYAMFYGIKETPS